MKRIVFFALAAVLGLAACDGGSPTAVPAAPSPLMMEPIEPVLPGDPGDGGGGGGGGGGGEPVDPPTYPTVEYRIVTSLYRSGGDMKAQTEFQRGYNGYWTRLDAASISVYCYVNGSFRDGETEGNASLVHITFGVSYQYGKQITCTHGASYGGIYYSGNTAYSM